ncbi:MAG TPA: response regulator [Chitinophagales bacterium]|nr:response regulator [Chitinophagales bacterium]
MKREISNVLLADDDEDDRMLFAEAVAELPLNLKFTTVNDGEALMRFLVQCNGALPCVLFMDLNMPRKNGFECLKEIKRHEHLKQLSVVIYSTSYETGIVDQLRQEGAQYYLRKPSQFEQLKQVIYDTLTQIEKSDGVAPTSENFVIYS